MWAWGRVITGVGKSGLGWGEVRKKVIAMQAQGSEFNPQNSRARAKYGGVLAIPMLGQQRQTWGSYPS